MIYINAMCHIIYQVTVNSEIHSRHHPRSTFLQNKTQHVYRDENLREIIRCICIVPECIFCICANCGAPAPLHHHSQLRGREYMERAGVYKWNHLYGCLRQSVRRTKTGSDDMEVPVCVRVRVPVCVPVWLWGGVPVSFSSEVLHIILHLQGGTLYVHGRHPRVSILV